MPARVLTGSMRSAWPTPMPGGRLQRCSRRIRSAATRLGRIDAVFGAADPPAEPERSAERDILGLAGQTVGHFHIIEPLAAGGMGVVYRAIDTHLDRAVALKFPLPEQRPDIRVRERFLREARAAGALDHPNICSIHETGETADGLLFFAMPLYDGETLRDRIARTGGLPVADAVAIAAQIARGLHAAHRVGIIHRDLKPSNVIVLPDGEVKVLDFGLARMSDFTITTSRATLGTVSYMAPEQIRGEPLDGRADLWSLGVLLYEMLTGRRPFEGEQEIAIAHAILYSQPDRPSKLRPEVGPDLDALVHALMSRQPDGRRASADAVAAELAVPASRPRQRLPGVPAFAGPRRGMLVGIAAGALLIATAGVGGSLLRGGGTVALSEPRIVAVLPFDDAGEDEDTAYLGRALAAEIASQLSLLRAVAVPSEASAMMYAGSERPVHGVVGELEASALVSGRARRTGADVRLEIELLDKRSGRIWTRDYQGPVDAVHALQQRATHAIIAALRVDVTRSERERLARVPTTSPLAYDLYLRGRAVALGNAPSGVEYSRLERLQHAQSYYARSRNIDPDFASARARLALTHLGLAAVHGRTQERRDQARLEAEAALRLQPGLPEAHDALAWYWQLHGDLPNAVGEVELALAGRPNDARLHLQLGAMLRSLGRWDEAVIALDRATRFDPRRVDAHMQAALTYSRLRRYDQAIAHWDRRIAMDSTSDPFPYLIRGHAWFRRGNLDSLEAAVARVPLGLDGDGMTTWSRYTVHRLRGRHEQALASLDSARFEISRDGAVYRPVPLLRAQTLQRMGDLTGAHSNYEIARALLEDSVAAHPNDARIRIALGLAYAGLNRRDDAMREAHTATGLVPLTEDNPMATAFMGGALEVFVALGEADAAFELLELLLAIPAGREVSVPLLRLDPAFDVLRSDPRFDELLGRFSRN
jgi:eukaryotic-like serine/threonine-protein kinase